MAINKNDKGLTLIELLITIAVIAIVAAISVPVITNVIDSSRTSSAASMEAQVNAFIEKYTESGEVSFDGADEFTAWVDLDGDGVFSSPAEVIETFTVDTSQFTVEITGTNEAPTGATVNAVGANNAGSTTGGDSNFTILANVTYSKYYEYSNMLLLQNDNSVCDSSTFTNYTTEFRFKQSSSSTWTINIDQYSSWATIPSAVCSSAGSTYNAYEIGRMGDNYTGILSPGTSYDVEVRYYSPTAQVSDWYNAGTFITGTGSGK